MTPLARFADCLRGVRWKTSGQGFTALCPAHPDRHPSLSVDEGADGQALIICRAGCTAHAVVEACGLAWSDCFPDALTSRGPKPEVLPPAVKELGDPTPQQVAALTKARRIQRVEDLAALGVRRVHVWGGEWCGFPTLGGGWKLWAVDGSGKPRLDDAGKLTRRNVGVSVLVSPTLRAALTSKGSPARIFDVEGESDLLALVASAPEVAALTGTGGAATLTGHKRHRNALQRAARGEVIVVRDLDDAGRDGATKAAVFWQELGVTVRVLALPPALGNRGDLRDYLLGKPARDGRPAVDPFGSFADLTRLADSTPPWAPATEVSEVTWPDIGPWPTLEPAALYGLAGDIVRSLQPETEADAASLLFTFLVSFGNACGDGPHARVGGVIHPPRLFACLVGATAKARKGQSFADVGVLFEGADPKWWEGARESGLSSGEGIIARFRDDSNEQDRRGLFYEPEFARTLAASQRDKSTLSAVLRDAWDSGRLRVLTRTDPLKATGAHVSVLAHVTLEELRTRLTSTDIANGFANRFLFACVRRSKRLPNGGVISRHAMAPLAARIQEALQHARRMAYVARAPEAAAVWAEIYNSLPEPPGLLGALTARADALMLRLQLVYALADRAPQIEVAHVRAAEAAWRYAESSVRHIFQPTSPNSEAGRLLRALREVYPRGLDRTAQNRIFANNRPADDLAALRTELTQNKLAEERPTRGPGGRTIAVLFALPRSAEEYEHNESNESDYSPHPRFVSFGDFVASQAVDL